MPIPTSNGHASRVQIQESRTISSLHPLSPIAFKEQQGRPPPATQQTIAGKLFRNLFKGLFFSQLTLISLLVIVLTIRGLISANSHHFHPKKWYPPLLASIAVSGVASLAWQCIFIYNPSRAVKATIWLSPILTCSVGILLVLIGSAVDAVIGAVFVVFAISQSLYGCWITPRFDYTNMILSLSTAFPPARTREVVCLSIIVSIVYSDFLVTGIGGATSTRTYLDLLFIAVIMTSLAWTMQILKNVQQVAISRARFVNFAHGEAMDAWDAFTITVKHLIGSVCIGSTIVPIIVFIRGSIRSLNLMSGSTDEVMYSGADCFSSVANKLITLGNRWGFVHVGTYDKGFMEASCDTWKKFRSTTGLENLIDSDLTSSFCFLTAVSVGAVSSLTAGIWMLLIHKDYALEVTLYAFIIGYFMGRIALAWIQACVLAYYVAYSEDPQNMRFDDTIPRRIQRLQFLSALRDNRELELTPDLIHSILQRLSIRDLQRSKSVCWDWLFASRKCFPKSQVPWLLIFNPDDYKNPCKLFNPEKKDKLYNISQDPCVGFTESVCVATYGCWLLMRNPIFNLYIVNLLTGQRINLPPVESQSGPINLKRIGDDKFHAQLLSGSEYYHVDSKGFEVTSPRLWVDDEEASDFVVIFTFGIHIWSWNTAYAIFCRKGDEVWRDFPDCSPCTEMVYKHHKLYALRYENIQIFDFSGEIPLKAPETDEYVASFSFTHPDYGRCELNEKWNIVVTVSGHVLIVVRVLTRHKTWSFRIYKMSSRTNKWERVVSLGGEAMLLDLGVTVPSKDIEGINQDSIYFSDLADHENDVFVFDLKTENIERPHEFVCSSLQYTYAIWFFPQFTHKY